MRRLAKIIVAGFAGVCIAGIVLYVVIQRTFSGDGGYAQRTIETAMQKNGTTCQEVNKQATEFVNRELPALIDLGKQGKDWVRVGYLQHSQKVKWLSDATFQCVLAQGAAERIGQPMPGNFQKQTELFNALDTFITKWGNEEPSVPGLKPEAFERLVALHRDITSQSTLTR